MWMFHLAETAQRDWHCSAEPSMTADVNVIQYIWSHYAFIQIADIIICTNCRQTAFSYEHFQI